MITKRYLTPNEVSEFFGGAISPRTLANWRSVQAGPSFTKVGGRVLYPVAKLREWEEKRTVNGTGQYKA